MFTYFDLFRFRTRLHGRGHLKISRKNHGVSLLGKAQGEQKELVPKKGCAETCVRAFGASTHTHTWKVASLGQWLGGGS